MWSVLLCAGHRCVSVPFRSLRHADGPTVFAGWAFLNCTSTCSDLFGWRGHGSGGDYPPIRPMFVCVGCIVHVNYRNWNILPECDAWTVYWLGKWICRCFPCMAAERYGGQSHCRVRGENSIIAIAPGLSFADAIKWRQKAQSIVRLCTRFGRPWEYVISIHLYMIKAILWIT